jgi:hypothetical protein
MRRTTSKRFLVGSALILVIWIVSPASSSPSPQSAPDIAPADRESAPAGLIEMNEQVERLSRRLAPDVASPSPARNPFLFGRTTSVDLPTVSASAVVPVDIRPVAPRLVAILTDTNDAAAARSVVLSEGDAVEILKTGDRFGTFTIGAIDDERVELVESGSGAAVTLSLR